MKAKQSDGWRVLKTIVVCVFGMTLAAVMTTAAQAADSDYWSEPMKEAHTRFSGAKGTFAQFGDSITITMAFWAPLSGTPKNMKPGTERAHTLVKRKSRPQDWDGSLPQFKTAPGDEYQVRTLIARDGVHPSNPKSHANDFSEEGLRTNGYGLRNYLTLMAYADVIAKVLAK